MICAVLQIQRPLTINHKYTADLSCGTIDDFLGLGGSVEARIRCRRQEYRPIPRVLHSKYRLADSVGLTCYAPVVYADVGDPIAREI